jgi:hypothetical protein
MDNNKPIQPGKPKERKLTPEQQERLKKAKQQRAKAIKDNKIINKDEQDNNTGGA